MHKDKSSHEWDEEEKCNRYYERKLYDSMSVTLNRVTKETRKQPYFLENESRKDEFHFIGNTTCKRTAQDIGENVNG